MCLNESQKRTTTRLDPKLNILHRFILLACPIRERFSEVQLTERARGFIAGTLIKGIGPFWEAEGGSEKHLKTFGSAPPLVRNGRIGLDMIKPICRILWAMIYVQDWSPNVQKDQFCVVGW